MLARAAAKRGAARLLGRGFQSSADKLQQPEPVPLSKLKDSFLDGTSSTYLEELEERYRSNPASVDKSWASFFHSMGEAAGSTRARAAGPRVCLRAPAAAAAACSPAARV